VDLRTVLSAFDRERRELDVSGFQRLAGAQLVWHLPVDGGAGFEFLMVDARATSQPTLGRLGFRRVSCSWPCRWAPASSGEAS
jgi:hypothetical protein